MAAEEGQQHPLKIYWIMWIALFVLSAFSYATDFMDDGAVRTTLILTFMMLKAAGLVLLVVLILVGALMPLKYTQRMNLPPRMRARDTDGPAPGERRDGT